MKKFFSDLMFQGYQWQWKRPLLKFQQSQFYGPRARMQWWYYDFFCADGVTGTLAFIPYKWWLDRPDSTIETALIMFSIVQPDGHLERFTQEFDTALIQSETHRISIGDCFSLSFRVNDGLTSHSVKLDMPGVNAAFQIDSSVPPFSGLPMGSMSAWQRKIAFNSPWRNSPFRYVSQIPAGLLVGSLRLDRKLIQLNGRAYHEQGWFDGDPHLLHGSWYWFHFLHPQCNVFGTPEGYVYLQLFDQTRFGGTCVFSDHYRMHRRFDNNHSPKILSGGHISLLCKDYAVDLEFDSARHQDLILYTASESEQLWNTSLTAASCKVKHHGNEYRFNARALIESCWLAL